MPAPAHAIELRIPDAKPTGLGQRYRVPPMVPFLTTTPYAGWEYEEGQVRWTVAGVQLLDGSFGLYPWDQLDAVVRIVELAATRVAGRVNVPGSVITLSTTPLDAHHARFAADIPERPVRAGFGGPSENAEAVAKPVEVIKCVVPAARSWMLHIPLAPPPRPVTEPGPGTREAKVVEMLARLDAIQASTTRRPRR